MRTLSNFYGATFLAVALTTPSAIHAQNDRRDIQRQEQQNQRQEQQNSRRYHDSRHNDDHEWNGHEDQAYRMWAQQNHRKYNDFDRLRARDQQSYWDWRHNHSDAQLKIELR
jgi:hypothetical protein